MVCVCRKGGRMVAYPTMARFSLFVVLYSIKSRIFTCPLSTFSSLRQLFAVDAICFRVVRLSVCVYVCAPCVHMCMRPCMHCCRHSPTGFLSTSGLSFHACVFLIILTSLTDGNMCSIVYCLLKQLVLVKPA